MGNSVHCATRVINAAIGGATGNELFMTNFSAVHSKLARFPVSGAIRHPVGRERSGLGLRNATLVSNTLFVLAHTPRRR